MAAKKQPAHPLEDLIRVDRMPHIWCPGCGVGSVFSSCLAAIKTTGIDYRKFTMVSGIGCSGRGAGYVKLDSFHTTHGRAIPFASGIKMANPELNVIVFSGDGDLFAIGGNHFIHAARRNTDITVICINNLIYGMTGGQVAATTPNMDKTATTPYGNPETPFNLPLLAYASGATYVARWTMIHVRDLIHSVVEAINHRGFAFIEVLSPCPVNYGRRNKKSSAQILKNYQDKAIIRNGADPASLGMNFAEGITLGKFVHVEKATQDECYSKVCLGEK